MYDVLSTISAMWVVLPLLIGFIKKKYFNNAEKVLLCLTALSFITETIALILNERNMNNMYVYRIYTVLEFALISLFYILILSSSRFKPFIIATISFFTVFGIYDFLNHSDTMDNIATTMESIIVIIYSILGFHSMLKNPVHTRVRSIPLFWFNSAFLLYFAGNLFLFIFCSYILRHHHRTFNELWGIHSVMNILFYVLISVGFWKTKAR